MGYIRTNEDYYVSIGFSPENARREAERDKRRPEIDHGYCNPRKAKQAADDEKDE